MSERMLACSNCRVPIAESKYDLHEAFCVRNNIQCKRCRQFYDKNDPESHEEEFHSKQLCPYCNQDFQDLSKHSCSKKPKACLHCGLDFANDAILQHENVCGSRTEKCQICNKHIQLRDLRKHELTCNIEKEFPKVQDKPQRNEIYDKPYYENKQEKQLLEKKQQDPQQQQFQPPRAYTPKQDVKSQKPTFQQRIEPQKPTQQEFKRPDSNQLGRRDEVPKWKPQDYKNIQPSRQPPAIISNSPQVVDTRKNPTVQQASIQYPRNNAQDQQNTRFPIQEPKTTFDSNYDKDNYKLNKIVQPQIPSIKQQLQQQQQQQQQQCQNQNKYSQQSNQTHQITPNQSSHNNNIYNKQNNQPIPDRNQKDNQINKQQSNYGREQNVAIPQSVYVPKTYEEQKQKIVRPDTAIAREYQEQLNFEAFGLTEQELEDQRRTYESIEQQRAEQREQVAPKRNYEEKKIQPVEDFNFDGLEISEEEKRMQKQLFESMQQQNKPQSNKPSYPQSYNRGGGRRY